MRSHSPKQLRGLTSRSCLRWHPDVTGEPLTAGTTAPRRTDFIGPPAGLRYILIESDLWSWMVMAVPCCRGLCLSATVHVTAVTARQQGRQSKGANSSRGCSAPAVGKPRPHHQGWGISHFSERRVPVAHHPHYKKISSLYLV